jgi:hypothetical protein
MHKKEGKGKKMEGKEEGRGGGGREVPRCEASAQLTSSACTRAREQETVSPV